MITVYGSAQSRSFRALWALEESSLNYNYQPVRIGRRGENGTKSDSYKQLNPQGKVPSLQDDDFVVNESIAILNYIAALSPQANLMPLHDIKLRAYYDEVCSFVVSELEQALWTAAKHRFLIPKEFRVVDISGAVEWEFSRAVTALESYIDNKEFVVGDTFTMADILISHTLAWAEAAKFKIPTHLLDYKNKHTQRTAFHRAIIAES